MLLFIYSKLLSMNVYTRLNYIYLSVKLFLLTQWLCIATAVVCPDSSQWTLRARARCNSTLPSYNCLYDESTATFVDFCTMKPDFQRPGK